MANEEKKQKKNNRFFKDFKAELKKVIWPTPKQLVNNTIAVITIVLILAIIVFFLDVAFEALNTYGIDKIKGAVTTSSSQQEEQKSEEKKEGEEEKKSEEGNKDEDSDADKKDKEDEDDSKKDAAE